MPEKWRGGWKILQSRKSSQGRWHWNKVFLLFVYCCPVPTLKYKGTCKSHVTTAKTGPCAPFPPDPRPGCVHANFLHSCPTLFDPMDYSTPGSSIHGDSPGKNAGVGCHPLLQGIFPTQGSNSGLPHCRRILY